MPVVTLMYFIWLVTDMNYPNQVHAEEFVILACADSRTIPYLMITSARIWP